jgi:hypothetical protein
MSDEAFINLFTQRNNIQDEKETQPTPEKPIGQNSINHY